MDSKTPRGGRQHAARRVQDAQSWEGSGATGRAQNRLAGKAGTGRWKDSSRGHFRDDELTGGKIRPRCGRVRGESPDGGGEESRVGVGPGEDRSLCRHHLPNAQQERRPG